MGKDGDQNENAPNKEDGKHSVSDDKETGKQPDDFDLSEYGDQ